MQKEIERRINDQSNGNEIKLSGKIRLDIDKSGTFTVGKLCVKGIITVTRSNVVINGGDAEIEVNVSDCTSSDWSLFFVHPSAKNVRFENLNVKIAIKNPRHCTRTFSCIYNASYGLSVSNCRIEIISYKQINAVGIYNNGNLDTSLETRADNLVVSGCSVRAECFAEEFENECAVYGIYNYLANSISVQNTFIYATNAGKGERQKAIGIYTNGRFGRFVGNNVKANGVHNKGREKEKAHAYGFINDGFYSVISSNNIVGEWAGKSVGLLSGGEYSIVNGNKILATHTIWGRSIISRADKCLIKGNVITSTSRNARLIDHSAQSCIICNNLMEVLMPRAECKSGCGIYAVGEKCNDNIISENVIRYVADCGIFADKSVGEITANKVFSFPETVNFADFSDAYLADKLDEKHICSLPL